MSSPPNQAQANIVVRMARNARECCSELVVYELLFKLLSAALIAPATSAFVAALIAFSGDVSLSNDRIASFVLSPLGVFTAYAWAILGYSLALAEQAGLLVIAASAQRGQALGVLASIWYALRQTANVARLAAMQIAMYALVSLPFLGVAGLVYWLLLSGHDINYYLAQRPPEFVTAVVIGGVLATIACGVLAWLHIGWVFALPCCLLDGEAPRSALRQSRQMVKVRFWQVAKCIALWFLGTFAFGLILLLLVRLLTTFVVAQVGDEVTALIPALACLSALHVFAVAVVSFVSISAYSVMIVILYHDARALAGLDYATAVDVEHSSPSWLQRYLTRRRFAVAAAVVALAIAVTTAWGMTEAIQLEEDFAVTAHRGSSRRAPENSMAAIELAIAEGADFVEIDVQETADGKIVVFHDKDFKRLAGDDRSIWNITTEELAEIDIGSSHDPPLPGARVPLLAEVIQATKGKVKLNVELKFNGHDEELVKRVIAVIRDLDAQEQCVISSLDQQGLKQVRSLAPEIKTGMITAVSIGDLSKTDADFLSVSASRVDLKLVQAAHRRGKEVHAWTVNDTKTANRLIDMGVDNLLTDDPAMMVELRNERAALSTSERLLLQSHRWLGD